MRKSRILVLLLALAIFFTAGCAHEEDQNSQTAPPLAENIFTSPAETEKLPTNPDGTDGSSISIAAEVQKDEIGPYLVYEGGEMSLPLQLRISDLPDKDFGIHLYVDGQPQPYHTAENKTDRYMHSFPSMNGKQFTLDLIFTPVTGQNGDVLEIGFMIVAYPEYFIDDRWDGTTMMDYSCMGMTVRMKYLEAPPSAHLPKVQDRVVSLSQAHIDLTAAEADLFSSGEYQKEVAYEIYVNNQKSYGNLFSVTGGDKLDVEFELKGSSAADFGLVMYLDHQPVSIREEDLTFIRTQNGKKMTVKAEIDLSGFDGEGVFYAVIVPRNYRTEQLGGSCLPTILGPYYLSDAVSLDALHGDMPSVGMGFGLTGEYVTDETNRRKYLYHGGEMSLGYWLEAEGMSDTGIGFFLFVDGQPQPFKTESDDTLRYMHTIYPPEGEKITGKFIFTPVSGEQGDTLEIYIMDIWYPAHSIDDPPGAYQTAGAGSHGSRMLLEQTPPDTLRSDFEERVLSGSITHTDLTESEIRGWSEEDLRNKLEYHFYVNGRKDFAELFSIADTEPLDCRFEMWGCPNGEFTLTIFLNHEPVYVQDISTNYGQKATAEIQLDISGYGREGVLFAVLVPKNRFAQKLDYGLESSGTFYLTTAASEEALRNE